jgi:hypothetical protein
MEVETPVAGKMQIRLFDESARLVMIKELFVTAGGNNLTVHETSELPPGMYTMQVQLNGNAVVKKLIRQ